ncbi:MAG: hypothetical protein JWM56_216 [Candidatus Peribacteria bacterium]|nr:hypothetical protein [Candidatus Peribacteria bacterium]
MQNQFTEVQTIGYGSRIVSSIKGIFFGLILFGASFLVLYWNEGRVDLSQIAKNAVEINATTPDTVNEGKLVSITGPVRTDEDVSDGLYLKADKYIAVNRKAEMYAWVEHKQENSHKNVGGSETVTTTYTYSQGWTNSPKSDFQHPEDHVNPSMSVNSTSTTAQSAKVGVYKLDVASISLPSSTTIALSSDNVKLQNGVKLDGSYIFQGKGSLSQPQIGDVRISYSGIPSGVTGTVMGKLAGSTVTAFIDPSGNRIYRIFQGGSKDEAVHTLNTEYKMWLWIVRAIGFLMMWIGLCAFFGLISVLLDVLPIFGSLSRTFINFAMLMVAVLLTGITIIVSDIIHSPVAIAVALVIGVVISGVAFKMLHRKRDTQTIPVQPVRSVAMPQPLTPAAVEKIPTRITPA